MLKKVRRFAQQNSALANEIKMNGRDLVRINISKSICEFKNGSSIESFSINQVVGERTKILIVDEAPRANEQDIKKNAEPTLNTTRDCCIQNGYEDFASKIISITSACLKNNYFYRDFTSAYEAMKNGNPRYFACALNYRAAVRCGLSKQEYYDARRKDVPEPVFATEYDSKFLGAEAGSMFPYELTDSVRSLGRVECQQPKGSKCWYILSMDLASSSAKGADNAVMCIIKAIEKGDGTITKQVVFMRSYHGWRLDALAAEIRKMYLRFPGIVRVIYDAKGLGFSFATFFSEPWVDEETGKEYPAWTDDGTTTNGALPMLLGFKATPELNMQLVSKLRVAMEQKTVQLPVASSDIDSIMIEADDNEEGTRRLSLEESAIYIEVDALQVELGSVVAKTSGAGNVIYDTDKPSQHKDRYSALAMGVWYIAQIEDENKRKRNRRRDNCIGIVDNY